MNSSTTTAPRLDAALASLQQLPAVSPPEGFLPLYLPASIVLKLRRLADAARIEGGADGFATLVIGETVTDAASSTPQALAGAADLIMNSYDFPDHQRPLIARRLAAAASAK